MHIINFLFIYNMYKYYMNPGKPAFGTCTSYAGNYIENKKAKLLYSHLYNSKNSSCKLGNQQNYLLFKKAEGIRNEEVCVSLSCTNNSNLESGLYSKEDLNEIPVICEKSVDTCSSPTTIDITTTDTFYWKYRIDPTGALFSNCSNYTNYRVYEKPPILTSTSLVNCIPTCVNYEQVAVCNAVCNNKQPFIVISGNPSVQYVDNYYYITCTKNSSIQFLENIDNVTCILVGGGGAGAGGNSSGNSGGGGGGGGGVSVNNISLLATDYTIVVGQGGSGTSNGPGETGGTSSILPININAIGGGGGNVGVGIICGAGGIAGVGGGNGGYGYNNSTAIDGTNGFNGSTVPNLGLFASGGSGGPPNDPGNPGNENGGGIYYNSNSGGGGANGISASFYGCGGGASSGDGLTIGPYTGGNGAPGVVFLYFYF